MSLLNRKPRPLARDESTYRDDRLFLVACDDTYAPKQYFNVFALARVKIFVIPTEDGTSHARQVLERLLAFEHEEYDERWMLLDTDHCVRNNHIHAFISAIKDAKDQGVKVAVSRSCFEIWLLLHYADENFVASLGNAGEVENALREKIGEYNKTNLKMAHYPLSSIATAYRRAKTLDTSVGGGDIPDNTTTRVYLLLEAILQKSPKSQLPEELLELINSPKT